VLVPGRLLAAAAPMPARAAVAVLAAHVLGAAAANARRAGH
jgi:hypothetical protein